MTIMAAAGAGGIPDTNIVLPATNSVYTVSFGMPAIGVFRLSPDKRIYHGYNGYLYGSPNGALAYSDMGEWCAAGGTVSNYDVRASLGDGSLNSGTTGTWLNLGTMREWSMADYNPDTSGPDGGTVVGYINLEIRNTSTGRPVFVGTVSFSCQRYS